MSHKLNERFRLTAGEEGGVLLDLRGGDYWQLNGLALTAITRLAAGEGMNDIISALQQEYPDAAGHVVEDVRRIVGEFQQIGAITDE